MRQRASPLIIFSKVYMVLKIWTYTEVGLLYSRSRTKVVKVRVSMDRSLYHKNDFGVSLARILALVAIAGCNNSHE